MAIDWQTLKQNYIRNATMSLEDIAAEAGIDSTNLKRTASADGWYEQKRIYQKILNQKATKKLLTETAEAEAQSLVERNLVRANNWRLIQQNLMALVAQNSLISHETGLPKVLTLSESLASAKLFKEIAVAMEKSTLNERLELGQSTSNPKDISEFDLKRYQEWDDWQKSLEGKSAEDLRAEADALRAQLDETE